MVLRVSPCRDRAELEAAFSAIGQYLGVEPTDERLARLTRVLPVARMHAAREGRATVGGAGAYPFRMTVPGAVVAAAGTTIVGVYPTHRRRGVLSAMMKAQLEDFHARGEVLAALFASEESIYGRFGYGVAGRVGEIALPREGASFAAAFEPEGQVRILEAAEAAKSLPKVYASVQPNVPGMFERSRDWWESRLLSDAPERRGGGGPKRFAVLEQRGRCVGYAIYRHHMKWDSGVASGRLEVIEAIALDGRPTAELWRYLLDIDWVGNVTCSLLPIDHPLFFLLAQPRRMKFRVGDGLWARLVDVGAALSARSYALGGSVVFEIDDPLCPWNAGRWCLSDGVAKRTRRAPELACDVGALGSAYLGGFTWSELCRGGRVHELKHGALGRADGLFRAERQPWCPEMF